jgi:hypothetical protein
MKLFNDLVGEIGEEQTARNYDLQRYLMGAKNGLRKWDRRSVIIVGRRKMNNLNCRAIIPDIFLNGIRT